MIPAAPLSSLTDVVSDTLPETVVPFAGLVMASDGAVVSAGVLFEMLTLTGDETDEVPAASNAAAVKVAVPSGIVVVFHEN